MQFVDTHTHLFSDAFDEDREQVIERAIGQGVDRLFLPGIDFSSIEKMEQLRQAFPEHCFPMAGLHPADVKENVQEENKKIYNWISQNKEQCFGIGETGLDYYWDTSFVTEQKRSLHQHAQWAKEFDLPIILHTRESFEDNLQIMQEEQNGNLRGIFHCFTGTYDQAQQVIDLGFLLGIGGVITFKNSGKDLREVLKHIDLQYIVLETDSPYLTPHPYRGKRNESTYIPLIASKLAKIHEVPIQQVAEQTTKNALQLFAV